MKKLFVLLFVSFAFLLGSCSEEFTQPIGSDASYSLVIQLAGLATPTKGSIEIEAVPIVRAEITLSSPNGNETTKTWTAGSASFMRFDVSGTGLYKISVMEVDSQNRSNTFSKEFTVEAGLNYNITITFGGSVFVDFGELTSSCTDTNGLVAYFPFNGNAVDESGNGNDGTLVGSASLNTTDRFGQSGTAYIFDGSSYIKCNPTFALTNLTETISVSFWAKINSADVYLLGRHSDSVEGGWAFYARDNKFVFLLSTDVGATAQDREYLLQNSTFINQNQYYHIVGTFDKASGIAKIYVNKSKNEVSGLSSYILTIPYNSEHADSNNLTLGTFWSWGSNPLIGALDDVRIYNRVITDDEVSALYHENGYGLSN